MAVTKAVIPAAGLGTRFLPAPKAAPKEMLPVVDKPAIQYVVEEAVRAGLDDVLMVTGRNKRPLEDHFDRVVELEQTLADKGQKEKLALLRSEAVRAGLDDVLMVTGRNKRPLEDHFDRVVELEQTLADKGQKDKLALV